MKKRQKVSLVSDMKQLLEEMTPQPVLMVRPKMARKYNGQHTNTVAEVVDLGRLNLAKMNTFETL